jgi:hypothetical protein
VSAEHYEVFYSQNVLAVLDVLLLYAHKDVYFVESQVHLFSSCTHDLNSYVLAGLVVVGFDHFSKGSPPQAFQKLITVADLFMLAPDIPSLKVVLA